MQAVYLDSSIPEKEVKNRYCFPENIMMENAASALEKLILNLPEFSESSKILIFCGSGNNGGDGFALARKLFKKSFIQIISFGNPKTSESKTQFKIIEALKIPCTNQIPLNLKEYNIIVDCLYGTGFHGEFSPDIDEFLTSVNSTNAIKIACDIPSGLDKSGNAQPHTFKADFTVTMGGLKTALFSDSAKDLCGKITVADLGISREIFNDCQIPDMYLIEKKDIHLPFRTQNKVNKGSFGHTVVYAGEKSGAAILSATAAMNFGSGLTSLLQTQNSNLKQFKISPELMLCNSIPPKTSCIVIGNGLGKLSDKDFSEFCQWINISTAPNCVLDADIFSDSRFSALLEVLNKKENCKIIATPHPKEFQTILNTLKIKDRNDYTISEALENRYELGKEICKKYENLTLVLKSANTFILTKTKAYIMNFGSPALAKGGSGDVLAGIIGALLSQGYNSDDAAITGSGIHGLAAQNSDFSLTPEILIQNICSFGTI